MELGGPTGRRSSNSNCCQESPSSTRSSLAQQEFLNFCVIPTTSHASSNKTPYKSGGGRGQHANRRGGQEAKLACKHKSVLLSNHSRKVFRGNTKLFLGSKAPTHNNQGPHLTKKLYKELSVVKDANVLPPTGVGRRLLLKLINCTATRGPFTVNR